MSDEIWDDLGDEGDDGDYEADDIDLFNDETFGNADEWNEDEHEQMLARDDLLSSASSSRPSQGQNQLKPQMQPSPPTSSQQYRNQSNSHNSNNLNHISNQSEQQHSLQQQSLNLQQLLFQQQKHLELQQQQQQQQRQQQKQQQQQQQKQQQRQQHLQDWELERFLAETRLYQQRQQEKQQQLLQQQQQQLQLQKLQQNQSIRRKEPSALDDSDDDVFDPVALANYNGNPYPNFSSINLASPAGPQAPPPGVLVSQVGPSGWSPFSSKFTVSMSKLSLAGSPPSPSTPVATNSNAPSNTNFGYVDSDDSQKRQGAQFGFDEKFVMRCETSSQQINNVRENNIRNQHRDQNDQYQRSSYRANSNIHQHHNRRQGSSDRRDDRDRRDDQRNRDYGNQNRGDNQNRNKFSSRSRLAAQAQEAPIVVPPQVQLSVIEEARKHHSVTVLERNEFFQDRVPTNSEGFKFRVHTDASIRQHDGTLTDNEKNWLTKIQQQIQSKYDNDEFEDWYYLSYKRQQATPMTGNDLLRILQEKQPLPWIASDKTVSNNSNLATTSAPFKQQQGNQSTENNKPESNKSNSTYATSGDLNSVRKQTYKQSNTDQTKQKSIKNANTNSNNNNNNKPGNQNSSNQAVNSDLTKKLVGTLGKITVSNVNRPRRLLDMES